MGRTALSKLLGAKELDKMADALKTRDPEASRQLADEANKVRKRAIRQMRRRPKKSKVSKGVF